jgi:hypothetical protein
MPEKQEPGLRVPRPYGRVWSVPLAAEEYHAGNRAVQVPIVAELS